MVHSKIPKDLYSTGSARCAAEHEGEGDADHMQRLQSSPVTVWLRCAVSLAAGSTDGFLFSISSFSITMLAFFLGGRRILFLSSQKKNYKFSLRASAKKINHWYRLYTPVSVDCNIEKHCQIAQLRRVGLEITKLTNAKETLIS